MFFHDETSNYEMMMYINKDRNHDVVLLFPSKCSLTHLRRSFSPLFYLVGIFLFILILLRVVEFVLSDQTVVPLPKLRHSDDTRYSSCSSHTLVTVTRRAVVTLPGQQGPTCPGLPASVPSWSTCWFHLPPHWVSYATLKKRSNSPLDGFSSASLLTHTHSYLDDDFALQLRGGRQLLGLLLQRFSQQLVSKDVFKDPSHLTLLLQGTMFLYGQDDWEPLMYSSF